MSFAIARYIDGTYDGPDRIAVDGGIVTEVVLTGDFEAHCPHRPPLPGTRVAPADPNGQRSRRPVGPDPAPLDNRNLEYLRQLPDASGYAFHRLLTIEELQHGRDPGVDGEPMLRIWMQDSVPPSTAYEERPGRWVGEPCWPSPHVRTQPLSGCAAPRVAVTPHARGVCAGHGHPGRFLRGGMR